MKNGSSTINVPLPYNCVDVAYKTETEAKVVPHICPKIEDSEMVIDEELAHLNPMVSFCQYCPH